MNRTLALLGILVLALCAAPAAAQSTATTTPTPTPTPAPTPTPTPTQTAPGYYDNASGNADSGAWLAGMEDASLEDILALSVRVGPFIIGTGTAQGGIGSAGVLLTGALVGAIVTGTGIRARVGTVAGAVMAVATTYVFVQVAIGPGWLYAVVLFVVGLVTTVALIRALQ